MTIYQRCPKGCDLGTLDLGNYQAPCDVCMAMGFVEVPDPVYQLGDGPPFGEDTIYAVDPHTGGQRALVEIGDDK
jgi:hypothetical protein